MTSVEVSATKDINIEIHGRSFPDFTGVPTMHTICPNSPAEVDVCQIATTLGYDCNSSLLCIAATDSYENPNDILFSAHFDVAQNTIHRYLKHNAAVTHPGEFVNNALWAKDGKSNTFIKHFTLVELTTIDTSNSPLIQIDTAFHENSNGALSDWYISLNEGVDEVNCPAIAKETTSAKAEFVITFNNECEWNGIVKDPADIPSPVPLVSALS